MALIPPVWSSTVSWAWRPSESRSRVRACAVAAPTARACPARGIVRRVGSLTSTAARRAWRLDETGGDAATATPATATAAATPDATARPDLNLIPPPPQLTLTGCARYTRGQPRARHDSDTRRSETDLRVRIATLRAMPRPHPLRSLLILS